MNLRALPTKALRTSVASILDRRTRAARRRRIAAAIRRKPADRDAILRLLPPAALASNATEQLRRLLLNNITPFWHPWAIDRRHGGYLLNHDAHGRFRGPTHKWLISQARMLWFFSRLARSPYGKPEHLDAARIGYDFIFEKMWDRDFGGVYWEVGPTGTPASHNSYVLRNGSLLYKSLLAQSYALYGVSEYARAAKDRSATRHACELFAMIEEKTPDPDFGGHLEFFRRDWVPSPSGVKSFHYHYDPSYKTFGTQVHLLEALIPYCKLTNDPGGRERLRHLVEVIVNKMVFRPICIGSQVHARDWTPLLDHPQCRHLYGHDLELIWLLLEANEAIGNDPGSLTELLRGMYANAVRSGFDQLNGGFFYTGYIGGSASDRSKIWWVQAEALNASLYLYEVTGDPIFAAGFNRTLEWIVHRQADWTYGDWHEVITENGQPAGLKAWEWKAAYHNGRSVLACLDILARLGCK